MLLLRLALVGALVLATAAPAPAAPPTPTARTQVEKTTAARPGAADKARALLRGVVHDGPRHTLEAIRRYPKTFVASVLGIGLFGALAHHAGVNPELPMLGTSLGALGYQLRQSLPRLCGTRGLARWRAVGGDVIWPSVLVGATYAGGHAVGESGRDGGDAVAVARAVADLVEHLRDDVDLRGGGVVERERHLLVAAWSPDPGRHDDQRVRRIEAGDLHGNRSAVTGARTRPVKECAIEVYRDAHARACR